MRLADKAKIGRKMGVDGLRPGFIVGMAGEVAIFQHLKPIWMVLTQSHLKGRSDTVFR